MNVDFAVYGALLLQVLRERRRECKIRTERLRAGRRERDAYTTAA